MKKLLLLGLSSAFVLSTASAATMSELESRIEALEYQGYENYTKITGSLEYRFDSVSTEYKDNITTVNTATNTAETSLKGRNSGAGYESLFFSMNIESTPTDKLSFYGKLSMAKYANVLNSSGTLTENAAFNDLSRGSVQSSSALFVERAFFNYAISKKFTFTAGRLPTSHGAPRHFSENSTRRGNYPILAFGGNWDGTALTYTINETDNVKLVYTPVSTRNFSGAIQDGVADKSGKTVDTKVPAYTLLYEKEKANAFGARNFYFIASYYNLKDMPTLPGTASDLYLTLDRYSFYTELSGVNDSNFDVAFHAVQSITKSKGKYGSYGWLTNDSSDTKQGTAFGLMGRYALTNSMKVGYEYFNGSKDVFLYDSVNQDGVSRYTTVGDMHHVFLNHQFSGNFKVVVGHIMQNTSHYRKAFGLLGESEKGKIVRQNTYARFIANF